MSHKVTMNEQLNGSIQGKYFTVLPNSLHAPLEIECS